MIKTPQRWDQEYESGTLAYYHDVYEMARHGALYSLIAALGCEAYILEIGCGDGASVACVPGTTKEFVGVDVPPVAIARAAATDRPGHNFIVRDAETWHPSQRFTAIVFNECLNYFTDPVATFTRYLSFLQRGGILAASIWHGNHELTKQIVGKVCVLHRTDIENERGKWALIFTNRIRP